jgi:hypothetical protein
VTRLPALVALCAFVSLPARAAEKTAPCAPSPPGETFDVPEGTRLYSKPSHAGDALTMVDVDLTLPVRARCGAWVEVVYEGLRGYVLPGDAYVPPLDIGVTASVGVTADSFEERLADAKTSMKGLAREAPLGPWTAVTDAPAKDLEPLARVAAHLAATFTERYGLQVDPPGEQAVALFTNLRDYRAFLAVTGYPGATLTRVAAVDVSPRSHVEGGIVASSLRDGPKLARIHLVHELTHLLQRRAFPGPLPRWLSEGMAEDLAWCRVDESGRLQLGSIQGLFFMKGPARIDVESQGPSAALGQYVSMLNSAPLGRHGIEKALPLENLLGFDLSGLGNVQGGYLRGVSRLKVTGAGLLVRFLLDGERDLAPTKKKRPEAPGPRAARFRTFLASVASGGPSDPQALFRTLDADPAALERAFDEWVLDRIAATH